MSESLVVLLCASCLATGWVYRMGYEAIRDRVREHRKPLPLSYHDEDVRVVGERVDRLQAERGRWASHEAAADALIREMGGTVGAK